MSGVSGSGSSPIPSRGSLADFASGIIDASKKQTDVKKREENRNFNIQVTDSTRSDTSAGQKRLTATLPQARQVSDMNTSLSRYEQAMSKPRFSISSLVAKVLVLLAKQGELQGQMMRGQVDANQLQFKAGMAAAKEAFNTAQKDAMGMRANAIISGAGAAVQLGGFMKSIRAANNAVKPPVAQTPDVTPPSSKLNPQKSNRQSKEAESKQGDRTSTRASSTRSNQSLNSNKMEADSTQPSSGTTQTRQSQVNADSKAAARSKSQSADQASQKQAESQKITDQNQQSSVTKNRESKNVQQKTEQSQPEPPDQVSKNDVQPNTHAEVKENSLDVNKKTETADSSQTRSSYEINKLRAEVFNMVNTPFQVMGQASNSIAQFFQSGYMIDKGTANMAQMEQQSYSQLFSSTSQSFAKISQNIDENRQNVLSMVSGWMSSLLSISRGA